MNTGGQQSAEQSSANSALLRELLKRREIDVADGPIFSQAPRPLGESADFGRIEGMCLGLAIGDALGNQSESMSPKRRSEFFGEIRDYGRQPFAGDKRGYPSDDTQLAFWALEQMIVDGRFNPEHVADAFCRGRIFGLGNTVRQFIENRKRGSDWRFAGVRSAGNGALMRVATTILPHLRTATSELWADAALSTMLTHNDSAAIASSVAFIHIFWELLAMPKPPDAYWWLRTFQDIASQLETCATYRARSPLFSGFEGKISDFVAAEVKFAFEKGFNTLDACERWHSGAYLLETVPCALIILMRHADDPEQALIRAVNDTWDNDTIAAIVGAAVGALHGREGMPSRWIEDLSGRTRYDDDGKIFQLLQSAKSKWW